MNWKDIKKKIVDYKNETSVAAILGSSEVSKLTSSTNWFKNLNDYSSEVSKSMDREFLLSLKGQATERMAPVYHRIVDGGHDLMSSIEKAREIGQENGWSDLETFKEWANAYFTDLSSPAGMPMFGKMSKHIYKFLQNAGIDEETARDIVTVNGQEAIESILSGSITFIAIFFAWKKEDKDFFSKTVGSIILSSTIMLNPVSLAIGIVAFAIGYQKLVNAEAMARGSIITGSGLALSALIPGPVLIGAIPALIVAIYISKKMGDDFKPIDSSKQLISLILSNDFKKTCEELFEGLGNMVDKEAA